MKTRRRKYDYADAEHVREDLESGLKIREVCAKYGMSSRTVMLIKKGEIYNDPSVDESPKGLTKDEIEEIVARTDDGENISEIAREFDVSRQYVHILRRKAGRPKKTLDVVQNEEKETEEN